jgi:hypothetical protein
MPDETPKLLMPKRPRKAPKQTPEEIEQECLLLTTMEKAIALLLSEQEKPDYELIAAKLHTTIAEVSAIVDSAPMKLYLQKLQDKELIELARLKVRKYRQLGINRGSIEARLMDLAMMDPSETKGNIDGQVKALAALADKFGYANKEDPLAGKSPAELEAILVKGHSRLIEGRTNGIQ